MALIILLMLLTASAPLPAEGETGSRVLVRSSLPDRPVAGSTWTLTLLIDHSEPNEVDVLAPHFDEAIFLEQVTKTPRLINPLTNALYETPAATQAAAPQEYLERWTAMEYRFVLSSPATVSFDAFTIITPQGQTVTDPFELDIQSPPNTAAVQSYRLAWEGAPPALKIGESAVFALRYSGKNYAGALPAMLMPPAPPGHILEALPLAPEETAAGVALKLRLIPLAASPFALARRQLSHGGAVFEVPALRIPVSRAERGNTPQDGRPAPESKLSIGQPLSIGEPAPAGQPPFIGQPPPFPPIHVAIQSYRQLYRKRQPECDAVYAAAKTAWEEGRRAEALASLRRNERDHPAGAFFAAIRRQAEQALGIARTNDEKRPTFGAWPPAARTAVVLRETAVRRIPDAAGDEIARFSEGQPALVNGKARKAWAQVTANDDSKTSGWVPEETIIHY